MSNEFARNSDDKAEDVVDRLKEDIDEGNVDRVLILWMDEEGETINEYSNARSQAEHMGMLHAALHSKDADAE